jgi:DNA-binding transcriptional LysR family regulator
MSSSHVDALDVGLLRALEALVSEQHVTRAAVRLGVTQSALSHSLARLRRVFSDPLLVRTKSGMVPTERALALAPEAERLLGELERLAAPRGALDPRSLRRTFVVGCHDFGELLVVGPLVVALAKEAPNVDLQVRPIPEDVESALASGRIDVLLGRFEAPPAGWVVSRLFEETYVTMLRRGHPALRQKLTPARFAALGHALIAPSGGAGGVVDEILATRGLRRRVVVRLGSFAAAPLVVSKTDLVVTLPTRIGKQMAVGLPVELLDPPIALPKFAVQLVFHELRRRDPAHVWFRAVLERVARRV